jgi:hypothetical protein
MGFKSAFNESFKNMLGDLPFTVELYWYLLSKHKPWTAHYQLEGLRERLKDAISQVKYYAAEAPKGKQIFLFASLHYWIDYTSMMALALAGKGHEVTFAFQPYAEWDKEISKFDLRKQSLYTHQVLEPARDVMHVLSLLDVKPSSREVNEDLLKIVKEVSDFDAQYTLQVEEVDERDAMYQLRYARNMQAARALFTYLNEHKADVVVIPNGTIQEMGVAYRVARLLEIETVTFEFGDQAERIWLAQNDEIMRHDTSKMWAGLGGKPLTESNREKLNQMFSARKNAQLWGKLTRRWQKEPSQGTSQIRETLGLDDRPVVILATNVLGDSLTLGRQVFSKTMADWLTKTVQYFNERPDVQLVIRVHPGEVFASGTSMTDVAREAVPELPEHIHLIEPKEKINTYDVVAIADLGLVYTTTVGLEMAMSGLPVVVAGSAHYRKRGFTHDPETWEDYFETLQSILAVPDRQRLNEDQLELAYRYAYLFFFEFPLPFPWHILTAAKDYQAHDMASVLGEEGQQLYGRTFAYLAGEKLDWSTNDVSDSH